MICIVVGIAYSLAQQKSELDHRGTYWVQKLTNQKFASAASSTLCVAVCAHGRLLRWLMNIYRSTEVVHRGAYTGRRALALARYYHTASGVRAQVVCFLTPIPNLCFVLAMEIYCR
jgi:hypothetical protein